MGQVIRLSDYRDGPEAVSRPVSASQGGPSYFCTRCNNDQFTLHASGDVSCASCGSIMRNLRITGPER